MKKTNILILLCIFISLFYWFLNPEGIGYYIVFRAANFLNGMVWTPVTALFVHANYIHLIGNMLFLYVFGNTLEDALGFRKMILAFFTGGIVSFVFSAFYYGFDVSMIGASAAIFTLTSVVMLTKPLKFSWLFFMPLGLVAMLYFTFNLFAVYYSIQGNVGYISHVTGFLIGFPFGIAWSKNRWIKNLLISIFLLILYGITMFIIENLFVIQ